MSTKRIKVLIDDKETEISIRRIKKKEFKDIVLEVAVKADEVMTFFDNKDVIKELPKFIETNFDFICDRAIAPFTSLTQGDFDEMDVLDVINLGKELLDFNGIDVKKFTSFLNPTAEVKQKLAEGMNFGGVEVPQN